MKKNSIAAKAMIALLAAGMISCANGNSNDSAAVSTPAASTDEAAAPALSIRYVDIDSVMATYTLSKELDEQGRKLMLDYQRMENQKTNELQTLQAQIQQKVNNNGYLSQESLDADVQNAQRKQNEAQKILGAHQEKIQKQLAEFNRQLTDSIQNFIQEYNASRKYDAILYKGSGLYFNPALDITGEIIEGLNARYTAAK